MKKILGISAFYHDSAAALLQDGRVVAAVQEERFTRKKHTSDFPVQAIQYCLDFTGFEIDELDAIVFYDKPLLKFERLLETYYAFSPKGLKSFLKAIPVWLDEKLFLKKRIYDGLKEVGNYDKKQVKLLFPEHHLSHAASAFYFSPYEEAAILTIDGVGEWATATIGYGNGKDIKIVKELSFPHSVGLLYSAFTYFLGFKVNSGEYKLMGLAPYGNPNATETQNFEKKIKEQLVKIYEDGSVWLDQSYFDYATGLRMAKDKSWEKLFGFPRRKPETEVQQKHCNLAHAIQKVTEEIVLKMAREAQNATDSKNLCMAGGVALNCVANGKLLQANIFDNIFVQPAAGDAGGALGAASAVHHLYFDEDRKKHSDTDTMQGSYLGPDFSEKEILQMCKKVKAQYKIYENFNNLATDTASKIVDGNVVGWFQERMEFGPRALGNRSILADPTNPEMQKKVNLKIKFREGFRPFAPAVLAEDAKTYFDLNVDSPYMLLVAPVLASRRKVIPDNYHDLSQREKLYWQRSDIPAVTHIDFSSRIQTVHEETNPRFKKLLLAFKKQTNYGLLLNTSFNVRGEPIVCTPHDAYRCFMQTEMDYLVINDFMFCKKEQPDSERKEKWAARFKLD